MKNKAVGITVALGLILFVLLYWLTDGFNGLNADRITVGSAVVSPSATGTVALINTTDGPTSGRYDSLQSPRGTAYTAPARGLMLTGLMATADTASSTIIRFGYADTAVTNSTATGTASVVLGEITLPAAAGFNGGGGLGIIPLAHQVPRDKIPWVRVTGVLTGTWPSAVIVLGVER